MPIRPITETTAPHQIIISNIEVVFCSI
jgi:hypothetical protein